jgi:hypothetical protein
MYVYLFAARHTHGLFSGMIVKELSEYPTTGIKSVPYNRAIKIKDTCTDQDWPANFNTNIPQDCTFIQFRSYKNIFF